MAVRIGVIGTGFGARVVAPVFAQTRGCEVVDVVSPRDAPAVEELVRRDDVDLVSIQSPPFLHADHVRAAIASGKAVLCDKPFGIDAQDSRDLLREAERAGVVHLVDFEFRYHPARRALRALVADGRVGAVEHVSWTHLTAGSRVPLRPYGWLFDRARGGGWIGAWASHAVDTIRFAFGEIVDAAGFPRTEVRRRPDRDGAMCDCTAEDGLTAVLRLEHGATVSIDSSFAATATCAPRLTVVGSEGVVEVVADERIVLRRPDGTREDVPIPGAGDNGDRHTLPMRRFARVVRDSVLRGSPEPGAPTFADGVACDEVLDRLRAR